MQRFNRAERRHQAARLKRARRRYWGMWMPMFRFDPENPHDIHRLGKILHTPQCCSCLGCGNQRQYEGVTRAERLQLFELLQWLRGDR